MLKMDLEYYHNILFVNLNGSLNKKYTYEINNYIVPILIKHNIKNIILNLECLNDIDEYGIYSISNLKTTMNRLRGRMYIKISNVIIRKKLRPLNIPLLK